MCWMEITLFACLMPLLLYAVVSCSCWPCFTVDCLHNCCKFIWAVCDCCLHGVVIITGKLYLPFVCATQWCDWLNEWLSDWCVWVASSTCNYQCVWVCFVTLLSLYSWIGNLQNTTQFLIGFYSNFFFLDAVTFYIKYFAVCCKPFGYFGGGGWWICK